MVGATLSVIRRLLNSFTGTITMGGPLTVTGNVRATGALTTDDGRVRQNSGSIVDMRTTDVIKFFRSDNTTFAEIQIGNTVNSVSPTSPNRTITMVVGGTTYYLHAKTTND